MIYIYECRWFVSFVLLLIAHGRKNNIALGERNFEKGGGGEEKKEKSIVQYVRIEWK